MGWLARWRAWESGGSTPRPLRLKLKACCANDWSWQEACERTGPAPGLRAPPQRERRPVYAHRLYGQQRLGIAHDTRPDFVISCHLPNSGRAQLLPVRFSFGRPADRLGGALPQQLWHSAHDTRPRFCNSVASFPNPGLGEVLRRPGLLFGRGISARRLSATPPIQPYSCALRLEGRFRLLRSVPFEREMFSRLYGLANLSGLPQRRMSLGNRLRCSLRATWRGIVAVQQGSWTMAICATGPGLGVASELEVALSGKFKPKET